MHAAPFMGGLAAAGVGVPTLLRAQPRTVKIGMVCSVSGRMLMYSNDLFGKTQTDSFQAALKSAGAPFEVVDVIPYPENAVDLSTEVARARSARPDVLAPARPATAILLLEELAHQRTDLMGIIRPGGARPL